MKEFKSLSEAFNYQTCCPFCDYFMEDAFSNWGVIVSRRQGYWADDHNDIISVHLDGTILDIDFYTGDIIAFKNKSEAMQGYHLGSDAVYAPISPNISYNKLETFGIKKECSECYQYDYTIQIHLSMDQYKITGLFLNSETLTIEWDKVVHEIRNSYATEQTEYYYAPVLKGGGCNPKNRKTITLPLVPFNLERPETTVQRLQNLIAFS